MVTLGEWHQQRGRPWQVCLQWPHVKQQAQFAARQRWNTCASNCASRSTCAGDGQRKWWQCAFTLGNVSGPHPTLPFSWLENIVLGNVTYVKVRRRTLEACCYRRCQLPTLLENQSHHSTAGEVWSATVSLPLLKNNWSLYIYVRRAIIWNCTTQVSPQNAVLDYYVIYELVFQYLTLTSLWCQWKTELTQNFAVLRFTFHSIQYGTVTASYESQLFLNNCENNHL